MTSDEFNLNCIEAIRRQNNINWMQILRIALKYAPEETKEVLSEIHRMDAKITYHTDLIANGKKAKNAD